MDNTRTEDVSHARIGDKRIADEMVPRVSSLIAGGALLQDRRLQVCETGEVRWVSTSCTSGGLVTRDTA